MAVNLPVWTIRPNWKQGVLERLEWLTDVLISDSGAEQRAGARLSPRRSFEWTVNPTKADRTYLDLAMHRLGSDEWLVPLWHDQGVLPAAAEDGDSRIDFDNRWREHNLGGYAILFRDTFNYEVVEIAGQDDDGLDLVLPLADTWPKGTKVYPLRRMFPRLDTALAALTRTVGESVLLWQVNQANDFPGDLAVDVPLYDGSPLFEIEPDRSRPLDVNHVRLADEADGGLGLIHRVDTVNRAFQVQAHNWQVKGREAQNRFRQMLYYLRGRQRMAWLPSFNEDVVISRPSLIGATAIDVHKVGFGYLGGPMPGRTRLWTGTEVLLHGSMGAAPGPEEERLGLALPANAAYAPGAAMSFLDSVRLDTDTIELQHHTDSDGVFECGATFRSFANVREAPSPIFLPIPASVKGTEPCGTPDDNPCADLPCEPATKFVFSLNFNGCKEFYCPTRNFYMPSIAGRPPGYEYVIHMPITIDGITGPAGNSGNANIGIVSNCAGVMVKTYERDDYINPGSPWYQDPRAIKLQGQVLYEAIATNDDFTINVYGALMTVGGQLQIQYGAFWCGDFIATAELERIMNVPPDCGEVRATILSGLELVGNTPYTFVFEG